MMYRVIGFVDATVSCEVDAESPQAAAETADLPSSTVCHQCAKDLEVGDVSHVEVHDDASGDVLYTDAFSPVHLTTEEAAFVVGALNGMRPSKTKKKEREAFDRLVAKLMQEKR